MECVHRVANAYCQQAKQKREHEKRLGAGGQTELQISGGNVDVLGRAEAQTTSYGIVCHRARGIPIPST